MTFSLPQLASSRSAVGFSRALGASVAYARATAASWLPIALLASAADLFVTLVTGGGIGIGGFLFSIWFVDRARRRGVGGEFTARILPTAGAQLLAGLLGLLALIPAGAAIAYVMTRIFGDAGEGLMISLTSPAIALTGDPFSDPLIAGATIVVLAGLIVAAYVSLRLSQTMFAAIAGAGPIESLRRSVALTRGSVALVLGWTIALSLLALLVALFTGLAVEFVAGPLGVPVRTATVVSSIIAAGLCAPISLGVFLTLFERLGAKR